jgi:hypothetical protein
VEEQPQTAGPDGVREWLLQLERRVTELERAGARAERRRRHGFWVMVVVVVAYVLLLSTVTDLV